MKFCDAVLSKAMTKADPKGAAKKKSPSGGNIPLLGPGFSKQTKCGHTIKGFWLIHLVS